MNTSFIFRENETMYEIHTTLHNGFESIVILFHDGWSQIDPKKIPLPDVDGDYHLIIYVFTTHYYRRLLLSYSM